MGEVLVTLGVVVLLFVGHLPVRTTVSAARAQASVVDQPTSPSSRGEAAAPVLCSVAGL